MWTRIQVWMWAIPVLVASLVFWPVWLMIGVGFAAKVLAGGFSPESEKAHDLGQKRSTMKLRGLSRRGGEALVSRIESHKYGMLAWAVAAATAFLLATFFFVLVKHDGEWFTSLVTDVGGYVAIAGLVLGLPALGYAMVTDSTVSRIETEMGTSKSGLRDISRRISARLRGFEDNLPDHHHVQVFAPNLQLTRLLPIYDPDDEGPDEGWGIDEVTPQALMGSAWVGEKYLWGHGDELLQPKLRLTADQLKRYENLTAVAAAPILEGERRIGVLTVFSKGTADEVIGTDWFKRRHVETARSLVPVIGNYIPEEGALSQEDLSAEDQAQ